MSNKPASCRYLPEATNENSLQDASYSSVDLSRPLIREILKQIELTPEEYLKLIQHN